jgi:hypothetical protein
MLAFVSAVYSTRVGPRRKETDLIPVIFALGREVPEAFHGVPPFQDLALGLGAQGIGSPCIQIAPDFSATGHQGDRDEMDAF